MQVTRLSLVSILAFVVLSVPSYSTLYYISPDGNNHNSGRTPQTAWRNVSYAAQQVGNDPRDPDTVLVFPGLYNRGAGETFPVMVQSYTALAGLDSGVVLDANGTSQAVIAVIDETAFWLKNLEITEGVVGIFVRRCSDFGIQGNIVHHNRSRGVKIRGSKRFTIRENSVISNTGGGLEIEHGRQIAVTGNTISHNRRNQRGSRELAGCGLLIRDTRAARVDSNVVSDNKIFTEDQIFNTAYGGGIAIFGSYRVTLCQNTIKRNEIEADVIGGTAGCYGGGVFIFSSDAIGLHSNVILDNLLDAGAEYANAQGGGVHAGSSTVAVTRNLISQNRVHGNVLNVLGGAGMCFTSATAATVQQNIVTENSSGHDGGGICIDGCLANDIVIGGEPGRGNDIYDNLALHCGHDLYLLGMADTVNAAFNYFAGAPEPPRVEPPDNWDTRFWRDNSILQNEPPHILSFSPTCAETTLYVGDSLLFWIESLDYDGDSTLTWWVLNQQPVAQGDSFLFVAEPQHVGYDTVRVNVTDGRDITSHEWYLEVIGERAATLARPRSLPKIFALDGNYPNPFNLSTVIQYQLPVDCHVRLEVYDLLGRKVATLVDAEQEAGYQSIIWEALELCSGLYMYKLTAGDFDQVKKMMLVK